MTNRRGFFGTIAGAISGYFASKLTTTTLSAATPNSPEGFVIKVGDTITIRKPPRFRFLVDQPPGFYDDRILQTVRERWASAERLHMDTLKSLEGDFKMFGLTPRSPLSYQEPTADIPMTSSEDCDCDEWDD